MLSMCPAKEATAPNHICLVVPVHDDVAEQNMQSTHGRAYARLREKEVSMQGFEVLSSMIVSHSSLAVKLADVVLLFPKGSGFN
jgi:hypothetical protein